MAKEHEADLDYLLTLEEEDLYALLADQTTEGFAGIDLWRRREIGRAWWEEHLPALRREVCGNEVISRLQERFGSDSSVVAAAIADAISSVIPLPAVFTASVLSIRYGLDRLCP